MNRIDRIAAEMLLKVMTMTELKYPGKRIMNVSDLDKDVTIEIKNLIARGIIKPVDGPLLKIAISNLINECVENDFSTVGSMRLSILSSQDNLVKIIEEAYKQQLYIVCADTQRAQKIIETANKMGLDIPFPITVKELPIQSCYIEKVLVDDIENVLTNLIGKPIDIATLNKK